MAWIRSRIFGCGLARVASWCTALPKRGANLAKNRRMHAQYCMPKDGSPRITFASVAEILQGLPHLVVGRSGVKFDIWQLGRRDGRGWMIGMLADWLRRGKWNVINPSKGEVRITDDGRLHTIRIDSWIRRSSGTSLVGHRIDVLE